MAEASLVGVSKNFGDVAAIQNLDLHVKDGEFVVLLGPTGAGKTTTLRLVAGLELPDKGAVRIGGVDVTDVPPAERDVAFVFQQYSLYPHYSVFDNLAFPLRARSRRRSEAEIKSRVESIAELLRIDSKLKNKSTELSGGEMQRVSIGRALVREPQLFLMDEPLSSLDAKLREDLRVELKRIQRELGATIIYVTHDQLEAMTLADRIGVLEEGTLAQLDEPRAVYEKPANVYASQRLGSPQINLIGSTDPGFVAGPSDAASLGVRPEDVVLNGSGVPAKVLTVEHLGVETVALLQVGERQYHTLLDPNAAISEGAEVAFSIRPGAATYFDREGNRMANVVDFSTASGTSGQSAGAASSAAAAAGNAGSAETKRLVELVSVVAAAIVANEEEIEGLDRAIGDGDHFHNMKRGSETLVAMSDELAALEPAEALKAIAKKLVMTIGGASGPLIASYFLEMSKTPGANGPWEPVGVGEMMVAGADAIKKRGKADVGMKTMLDVLVPAAHALTAMAEAGKPTAEILEELPKVAENGMESTRDMLAAKGRAAFLGERAIGHLDPGSKSCAVIIRAVCETLKR